MCLRVIALRKKCWHLHCECLGHPYSPSTRWTVSVHWRRRMRYFSRTLDNAMAPYGRRTVQWRKYFSRTVSSIRLAAKSPIDTLKWTHCPLFWCTRRTTTTIFLVRILAQACPTRLSPYDSNITFLFFSVQRFPSSGWSLPEWHTPSLGERRTIRRFS